MALLWQWQPNVGKNKPKLQLGHNFGPMDTTCTFGICVDKFWVTELTYAEYTLNFERGPRVAMATKFWKNKQKLTLVTYKNIKISDSLQLRY